MADRRQLEKRNVTRLHGSATQRLSSRDPIAARIAALSAEFLEAGASGRGRDAGADGGADDPARPGRS